MYFRATAPSSHRHRSDLNQTQMTSEIIAILKSDNPKTIEKEFLKQEEVDTKRNKIDLMKLNSMIEIHHRLKV